ncbi:MAG: L-histidine N(alpha)-methyltransferase [Acidobacteriota bacterium]
MSSKITISYGPAPEAGVAERELAEGLRAQPPRIPTRYFYDDRGSELFERITELPEYYQTRTERALLEEHAAAIIEAAQAEELVELGSGAATKTRVLLSAMQDAGLLRLFVPFDVSEGILRRTAEELTEEYPGLEVRGVVGNFLEHLGELPDGHRRLVAFLGGTVGNLRPETQAPQFMESLADVMSPGDLLLIGTDRIKDPAIIEAAYNDSAGVTAQFNLNALNVVNREFDANFVPEQFAHRAFYCPENRWIEMRLVSQRAQTVRVGALDIELELAAGEEILTEISAKYDQARLESLLGQSGFELLEWRTDEKGLFALSLARRV